MVCHQAKIMINQGQNCEGQSHGSSFLEFTSHHCVVTVFKCLQKPDVVFGYERVAKVASTESSSQVDEVMVLLHN